MRVKQGSLPGLLLIEPEVFEDTRGYLFESYNHRALAVHGIEYRFVQDNQSRSTRNVIRGLHYQVERPQGKLVRVIAGEVFDVAVDLRRSSPTFGRWAGMHLSAESRAMLWIPPGFAHGFLALSEIAEVLYKITDYHAPEYERCVLWNDRDLGIEWPLAGTPVISAKDAKGLPLGQAEIFP